MKLFKNLLSITFLISFPKVLRSIIGLKDLGKSYDSLLGFGIIMDMDILKWDSQWPNLKHSLAILIIFFRHESFLTIHLRCLQDILLKSEVDELLYLIIELINSSLENGTHSEQYLFKISFNTSKSTWQSWAVLNDKWRALYRFSISMHSLLLYLIASIVGSFCLLISLQVPNISFL